MTRFNWTNVTTEHGEYQIRTSYGHAEITVKTNAPNVGDVWVVIGTVTKQDINGRDVWTPVTWDLTDTPHNPTTRMHQKTRKAGVSSVIAAYEQPLKREAALVAAKARRRLQKTVRRTGGPADQDNA